MSRIFISRIFSVPSDLFSTGRNMRPPSIGIEAPGLNLEHSWCGGRQTVGRTNRQS